MNKLFTLMVLGSVASLSAEYYGSTYDNAPTCPGSSGYSQGGYNSYQEGGAYDQGQSNQGNYYQGGQPQGYQGQVYQSGNDSGYYQNGSRPMHVGTRPMTQEGRNIDQNQQYNQRNSSYSENRSVDSTTRNDSRNNNSTTNDLNKRVREALSGGWFSSGYKNVTFEVNGSDVTLRGNVDTAENKRNAEDAVRKIDGVRNVNNQITVSGDASTSNRGRDTNTNRTNNTLDNNTNRTNRNGYNGSDNDTSENASTTTNGYNATRSNGHNTTSSNANKMDNKYPQDSAATEEDRLLNAKIRDKLSGGFFSKGYETVILRTSNGIVVISGTVDTQDDVQAVHDHVKKVEGVRSVNNQVTVKSGNK